MNTSPLPWKICVLSLAVAVAASTGCINRNKTAAPTAPGAPAAVAGVAPVPTQVGPRYRVREDTTPFFRYGPQQTGGPDLSLKKGTDVVMIKRAFGYSQVKTLDTQQTGYVGTPDISPLTQQELTALAAAAAPTQVVQSVGGPGRRSRAIVGEYNLPPGGSGTALPLGTSSGDSLPMPAENAATPPPNNMFRY